MVVTTLVALLQICAPAISTDTALRLIQAESGGRQFAININGPFALSSQPRNYAEFVAVVNALDTAGYNFDFGFAQANNREVKRRGYRIADKVDPCGNLGFLQEVLAGCYRSAPAGNDAQKRLGDALSCYNTGRYGPGYTNGYVNRVWQSSPTTASTAVAVIPLDKVPPQLMEKKS